MDDSRGRRAKPVSKAKSALAELAELRRTGQKRIATYEFEEEADVYDTMDDDEYSKFTAKRRDEAGKLVLALGLACSRSLQAADHRLRRYKTLVSASAGDFIEDDDGLGYADMGEEDDWSHAADDEDAAAGAGGKKRKDGGGQTTGTFCHADAFATMGPVT